MHARRTAAILTGAFALLGPACAPAGRPAAGPVRVRILNNSRYALRPEIHASSSTDPSDLFGPAGSRVGPDTPVAPYHFAVMDLPCEALGHLGSRGAAFLDPTTLAEAGRAGEVVLARDVFFGCSDTVTLAFQEGSNGAFLVIARLE